MLDKFAEIPWESWLVLGQMSPYLLFGFLMAGALSVCISPQWVQRHLGGRGLGPVWKASLFGVPLPLCSCSVIPVSASIRRHGAGRSATTAFLLSTPQTGVDSVAITYALLGPVFAVFRPIAAFLTGLLGGGLVQLADQLGGDDEAKDSDPQACNEVCCDRSSGQSMIVRVLHYGLIVLPRDIGVALLVGVVIAGAMAALVEPGQLKGYFGGETFFAAALSILLMMAVGVPVYVCATASVPIAAGMMHIGASPGAALAFLIAGPATNAATFTTLWKLLGRRAAAIYLFSVALSAFSCGLLLNWLLNWLIRTVQLPETHLGTHAHTDAESGWILHAWAIGLLGVLAFSFLAKARWQREPSAAADENASAGASAGQRLELSITGMTCAHCADTVRQALAACNGVDSARVDFSNGRAVVSGDQPDHEQLVAAVGQLGYSAKIYDPAAP